MEGGKEGGKKWEGGNEGRMERGKEGGKKWEEGGNEGRKEEDGGR